MLVWFSSTNAQTLPVSTAAFEDYYRRMQLLGKIDSNISFTVRPLSFEALKVKDIFSPDTADGMGTETSNIRTFANEKSAFQILPVSLQTQYNTNRPYGRNDGSMIPARGFQSMISAGFFAKYGWISIQLRPEFVYAENRNFSMPVEKDFSNSYIDLPERFGSTSYRKLFPGQSSVRLTLGPVSFGVSSENMWWGPGIHNSLLMSNSAPGFNHLTLNTVKPIRTAVGSFEAQLIGGRLESSAYGDKRDDWRYLSGLTFSYQPLLIRGLFLGVSRSFQAYNNDINKFGDYFPFFQSFSQKNNYDPDQPQRDQLISVFARWMWKGALAETYFEYGKGDHSANLRDFILEPDHSRAYLVGFKKLIKIKERKKEYLNLNLELINLRQSINYTIRNAGSWYTHAPIYSGYTHRGEIVGAGITPGGNLKTIQIDWFRNLNSIGILFEHYKQSNDYFPPKSPDNVLTERNNTSISLNMSKEINMLLLNSKIQVVWPSTGLESNRNNNCHIQIGMIYRFRM